VKHASLLSVIGNEVAHSLRCRCQPRARGDSRWCDDWHDPCSTDEKVNTLVTQHAISSSLSDNYVRVVCDVTEAFSVLIHGKCKYRNAAPMIRSSLAIERAVVDIRATPELHNDTADDILAIHGLSGAEGVA